MPAIPSPGQVLRCDLGLTIGEDVDALTRFFISYTGSVPSAAELVTFAGAIATAYGTDVKAIVDEQTTLETVTVTDLSSDDGAQGEASPGTVGTLAGDFLDASACGLMGYEINRRYRGGHARGYWRVGVYADLANPQQWTPDVIAGFAGDISAFFSAVVGAGWSGAGTLIHVNVSFYEGFTVVVSPTTHRARNIPTLRVTPQVDTVTSIVGRVNIGTQRRRIHKVR